MGCRQTAKAVILAKSAQISLARLVRLSSGPSTPVYYDLTKVPYHPAQHRQIVLLLEKRLRSFNFEVIMGMAVGGTLFSMPLAHACGLPHGFVRSQVKGHGTNRLVDGVDAGDLVGKSVVLIEDVIFNGVKALRAVDMLTAMGARVVSCVAVLDFGLPGIEQKLSDAGIQLSALTTGPRVLDMLAHDPEIPEELRIDEPTFHHVRTWYEGQSPPR